MDTTKFEQQVAEALQGALLIGTMGDSERRLMSMTAVSIGAILAPRVVAAVETAIAKLELLRREAKTEWTTADARDYAVLFALAALRGEK